MAKQESGNFLTRFSSWFFIHWKVTLCVWVALLAVGAVTYTKVIPREGFPAIQIPISVIRGTYIVDDVERVDREVVQPLNQILDGVAEIDTVTTTAGGNFFTAQIMFNDDTKADAGTQAVQDAVRAAAILPEQAHLDYIVVDPAAFLNEYDLLLSVYATHDTASVEGLEQAAQFVASELEAESVITTAKVERLTDTAVSPQTGKEETRQARFNMIGLRDGDDLAFYPSITIGVDRDASQMDILELSKFVNAQIEKIDLSSYGTVEAEYKVVIGSDFAESINTQISSLESNLFTGLLAVAIVSLLLITWRASIITALFMISVMLLTVLVLYIVGYSLNTITLFALVLSLGLFVDDATIVVESIDASKRKRKKPLEIVKEAVRRVGAASFAGTFTTVLVFLPLAFLTGILGEFIRLMPITIIIALLSSLLLSLTLIPFLSKYILLRSFEPSAITRINPIPKLESKLAFIAGALPRTIRTRPKLGALVVVGMVSLSVGMFMASGVFAQKLPLNIFPPTKDSDQIGFQITYPDGYSLEQAELIAAQINKIVEREIGPYVVRVSYGRQQQPNPRSADALIELTPFDERELSSPAMIEQTQAAIDAELPADVSVRVIQFDAGPPVSEFPLQVQVYDEDTERAFTLAAEVEEYISGATITRQNGQTARITNTRPPALQTITRTDGTRTLTLQGAFDADDTSALLAAAESYIREKFTEEYLVQSGYEADALGFDFGQESDNAESFASLAWAFPLALLLMYLLLAVQFRSFLQPILIFMAIPFTLFGVFAGLYATDNSLSFFVQVGLIGLIGIAVNNTILLTDYANQERRAGLGPIEAIANAAQKRFRPLVTTTLTTVVALLPLAMSDPFWEALAYTIIFGLLSSTFLVILSFPYYYLGAEWLRLKVRRPSRKKTKA